MKAILKLFSLLLLYPLWAFAVPSEIKVPGFESRFVRVSVPTNYSADKKWPVVLLLHGYGGHGSLESAYLGLEGLSSRFGYILIAPDGTPNPEGKRFWNAWSSCCDAYSQNVDDLSFLQATLETVQAQYATDRQKVYLIGHSNGGFMAYRFACEKPGLVTAVASLAGTMGPEACADGRGVSVIHIHGTSDEIIHYNGGQVLTYPPYDGAEQTVKTWAAINDCNLNPVAGPRYDFVKESELPGVDTVVQSFGSCRNNVTTELWTIQGGSHIPGFQIPERTFTKTLLTRLLQLKK